MTRNGTLSAASDAPAYLPDFVVVQPIRTETVFARFPIHAPGQDRDGAHSHHPHAWRGQSAKLVDVEAARHALAGDKEARWPGHVTSFADPADCAHRS